MNSEREHAQRSTNWAGQGGKNSSRREGSKINAGRNERGRKKNEKGFGKVGNQAYVF